MLVTNPAHRATVSEVIIHPWMNKGYDAPVNNYLPDRPPLTLPVDMDVVRGMTGFEFGTETEIKENLEKIIQSNEYQKAAKILAERTAETHRNHRQGHSLRFSPHSSKKMFVLPNEDPQSIPAAYHPLVSIYYLVKERLERENGQEGASPDTAISPSLSIPDISLPENAHGSTESVFGDETVSTGVAYGKKGKAAIHLDKDGHIVEAVNTADNKLHAIENGINRLFTRTRSNQSSEHHTEEGSPGHDSNNVLRRLSLALSRTSTDKGSRSRKSSTTHGENTTVLSSTSTPIQIPSRENDGKYMSKSCASPKFPNSKYNSHYHQHDNHSLEQSDVDVATAAAAAASVSSANTPNNNTFGNKISKILPRRMTLGQSNMNAENHTNFLNMVHGHHQQHEAGGANSKKSTSKKAPGLFVDCEAKKAHNHEQSFPATAGGSFQQKGTADENIKPVFLKGLFSVTTTSTKHPSVIRADLIRVLERIGVKWRESKGRFECVHMPSIDLNVVVSDEIEDQQSFSSEEATTAVTNTPVVPLPDLVVRFEIYIVKVPWLLGMHGLQFRRVGGDPWQYKNMCSKILTELKL